MKLFIKRRIAKMLMMSLCCSLVVNAYLVLAAEGSSVVINEIAWMGSTDSSADEWIELYNASSAEIDLSGWKIVDDEQSDYVIKEGKIAAFGYFVIENREDAVKGVDADALIQLSLANSGDSLTLKDADGNIVDKVNSASGAWFAGDSPGKKTMERVVASQGGDEVTNWGDNEIGNGSIASGGGKINGTPGALNSVSSLAENAPRVEFGIDNSELQNGGKFSVTAKAVNLEDVFAYGFEVVYDPTVLKFVDAQKGSFLNQSNAVDTSFQAALEDNVEGKLLVAEARTVDPRTSVNGSGNLFDLSFEVIGRTGSESILIFAPTSFVANDHEDLAVNFVNGLVKVGELGGGNGSDPVINLAAKEGENRYELALSWEAPSGGVDKYRVLRKAVNGEFVEIGIVEGLKFTDKDGVENGGALIPGYEYEYHVVPVVNNVDGTAANVKAKETRGLKADANRSDRVDGRDLEMVARHFASEINDEGFDRRVDTNYDGVIDGSDLIDLAADWAKLYQSK